MSSTSRTMITARTMTLNCVHETTASAEAVLLLAAGSPGPERRGGALLFPSEAGEEVDRRDEGGADVELEVWGLVVMDVLVGTGRSLAAGRREQSIVNTKNVNNYSYRHTQKLLKSKYPPPNSLYLPVITDSYDVD